MTEARSDAYGYNTRSELTNAVKNATLNEYAYQYDDIGNRETSFERGMSATYAANSLNQYTDIEYSAVQPSTSNLQPLYDADGTKPSSKPKPASGRSPTTARIGRFVMGRRVEYIETVSDDQLSSVVTNKHQKFVYDGYLCIQRLNGARRDLSCDASAKEMGSSWMVSMCGCLIWRKTNIRFPQMKR